MAVAELTMVYGEYNELVFMGFMFTDIQITGGIILCKCSVFDLPIRRFIFRHTWGYLQQALVLTELCPGSGVPGFV